MLISEFVSAVLQEFEFKLKPLSESELKDVFTLFSQGKPIDRNLFDRTNYPAELVNYLNGYKNSTLEATHENLTPFINVLSDRWEKIKYSTISYDIAPNDISNRAYMILARHLAQTLHANRSEYMSIKLS